MGLNYRFTPDRVLVMIDCGEGFIKFVDIKFDNFIRMDFFIVAVNLIFLRTIAVPWIPCDITTLVNPVGNLR